MVRGWTLLIFKVKGQGHSGHIWKKAVNLIQTKPLCASLSNLADMLAMVNRIDFGGHSSKVKVMMDIIDKCWVCGGATLCIVIFQSEYCYFLTFMIFLGYFSHNNVTFASILLLNTSTSAVYTVMGSYMTKAESVSY